jgi:mRNA-degrading endonuclease HigB of HigAB toxin-antitoxin module
LGIVYAAYQMQIVAKRTLRKFVGTHKDYDRIDPETV